jgi:hypothetical protein
MKKVQTNNHRQKSIGSGGRTVGAKAKPRNNKKRSITSAVGNSSRKAQTSRAGQRSGCSGCSRSAGRK